MCARLLSCPLCSQPGFVTLDALRAGLVSVATRPLSCPVCNETLLGIDKLTIHLFGHTINANNRTDNRKSTDSNRNNNLHQTSHNETMIFPQNWNSHENPTNLSERTQTDEITNKITFVPLSNVNSSQTVATIVINKDCGSSSVTNSQGYGATDTMVKGQNQIIFVQNSSQQQQFCTPRLFRANHSLNTNITNQETFQNSVPMIFHGTTDDESVPVVVASQNCLDENPSRSHEINGVANFRSGPHCEHPDVNETVQKEETTTQFSETWIENLLQENSEKCCETGVKSTTGEDAKYSIESHTDLPKKKEKYSNFHRAASLMQNDGTDGKESRLNSQNLSVERREENFNGNQSRSNSIDILPQLKAFRLLAMKEKTERCDICGIPVPDKNILILHKQVVHMIPEKDINAKAEQPLKNYPCHFCTKVFKNRGSLMVHMRIAHIGYNLGLDAVSLSKDKESELSCCENGFNCPTCGKNFRKEQHVTQHLKTHEGKQWECDVCSKMFTTKYFLKKHKRLHSGEMPYRCTICEKTFTFQQSYHKHRLYHKDDKPHTCATCGRSFKELSTLHNHERIHTGAKPFGCETCGKCFRQRVSYLVHRRIHTGVMPYKCIACGKSFRYKVSQRTHKCPVQSEDSAVPSSETSGMNSGLISSSCDDSTQVAKTSILLQNPSISELSPSDNNKFILIVNTHGQPILTRESDVRTSFLNDKQTVESLENHKVQHDERNDLWKNLTTEKNVTKNSMGSPIDGECTNANEKLSTNEASDFFSLVSTIPPLDNDVSSPSTEMEHLCLSSPRNEEKRQNDSSEICKTNSTNSLQRDLNNAIDGIFREDCSENGPLETINEESLKLLLYGIDRKV